MDPRGISRRVFGCLPDVLGWEPSFPSGDYFSMSGENLGKRPLLSKADASLNADGIAGRTAAVGFSCVLQSARGRVSEITESIGEISPAGGRNGLYA